MGYTAYVVRNEKIKIFDTSIDHPYYNLISPKVTIEAGKAGSFDFTVGKEHTLKTLAHRMTDIVEVYRDGESDPIWAGRIYEIKDNYNLTRSIRCEGILALLNDSVVRPQTVSQQQIKTLISTLAVRHNEQVNTDKQLSVTTPATPTEYISRVYSDYQTTLDAYRDFADAVGGYVFLNRNSSGIMTPRIVTPSQFTLCSQPIDSRNLLDVQKVKTAEQYYTVIVPLGKRDSDGNRLTIASVNSGKDYIKPDTISGGTTYRTVVYDCIDDAQELYDTALAHLEAVQAGVQAYRLKVRAIDRADAGDDVEHFHVGQKILVTSAPHDINGVYFNILKQVIDIYRPDQSVLELETTITS